nr:PREDICTED: dynein beta chain, ciliary-like [Megachile rotundata]
MGSIANRPIILSQLWHNYEDLMQRIDQHFSDTKVIFDQNFTYDQSATRALANEYLPPVAARLCSLMKLRERVNFPVHALKLIDHPLINAKMENELKPKYEEMMIPYVAHKYNINSVSFFKTIIAEKEEEIFEAWKQTLPEILETHLTKTLLIVHEDRSLELNFAPELKTLLREIRYMLIMKRTDLPEEATQFYERSQFFFMSTYDLSLIANW